MCINILRNLLIVVTMSLLVGCGGGSNFTPANLDNNSTIPDDNGTTPDDNGTVPDDNGTTPDDNGTVLSKGTATASKGPFRAGALVTAYRLDEQLQRTGEYKETNTTDDKGTFSIELPWTGLTEINVVGDYYNELTGTYMSDGNLSTFVYMQGGGDNPVGVNVATHMMHEMMKKKVEEDNTSDYEDIEKEAEAMLKEFFGLDDNLSLGELNITDDGRESRQLLALSLAIASSDNPNELMGELSVDIADDGEVNDEGQGAYQELQEGFGDIDKKIEEAVENMQNDINGTKATKTSSALDGTIISTTIDFEKVNSAYLDTNYTSNEVTIDGIIGDEAVMKLKSGEVYYRLNGADPVLLTEDASVMVINGDLLSLHAISASTYETRTVNKIEIGGKTFKFVIKTMKDPFVEDDEPDDFDFGFISDAKVSQDYESSIVVSGINVASPISIEDGEYSIDGGVFTAADGTVENDDNVTVRLTASDDFGDKTKAIVTIGGVKGKFFVKTERKDNTPDEMIFAPVVGADKSELVESEAIKVEGINTEVTAKIKNGKLSVNGGNYVTEAQVNDGDTIKLQVTAPSSYDASKEYIVRVGRISASFEVQTMSNPIVSDTTPDAFSFGAKSVDTAGMDVFSDVITVASINQEVDIEVSGGSYKINTGSFTSAKGKVKVGDQVQLKVTAPDYGKETTATLTIGGVKGAFTVSTTKDDTPDSGVSFTTQTNVDRDIDIESDAIKITGINVPIPVVVDGGEVSINGGAYTTSGNISNNQTLKVKLRSSAKANEFSIALVSVGTGLNLPFVVKTKAAKPVFGTVPTLNATEDAEFKTELLPYLTEGVSTQWSISGNPAWLMINPLNGRLFGAPKGDASVGTHTVTVTAVNGSGQDSVTFDVVVADFNYAPVLTTALPDKSVAEDSAAFTIALASTDQDSKDTATYSATSSNTNLAKISVSGSQLSVTPVANANGKVNITVTVTDNFGEKASKTFALTINPVNDAPVLDAIANQTVAEDGTLAPITLSATDDDTGDTITYKATSLDTSKATVQIVGNQLTVTPVANANGTVSIDVYANDGTVNSNKQTFSVTITPVPDVPTLAAIPAKSMKEDDAPLVVTLSATDADGDTAITYSATSSNESLVTTSVNGNQLTLTLVANENGEADITVKATDSTGSDSNVETFKLTVTSVNDAPEMGAIAAQEMEEDDEPLVVELNATDIDEGTSFTYSASSSDENIATVSVSGNQLTITPVADANGDVTISVTANDGTDNSEPVSFVLTITPQPDTPELASIADQSVAEDGTPIVLTLNGSDADGDTLSYEANSSDETKATVSVTGNQLTITPVADQNGEVTVTVQAKDAVSNSTPVSFTVTITPENDKPVVTAIDDMTVNEDDENSPFTVNLSATDIDGDTTFTYRAESSDPSIASVQIVNGNQLEITLQENKNGSVTISVVVNDGTVDSQEAETFIVNITAVNDTPVLSVNMPAAIEQDRPLSVQATVTDPDLNDANSQEVHTFSLSGQPAWMSISSTGLITGTPINADIGITTDINLTVTDKAGLSDSYVFDFEVKDKNDIPTITGTPETTAVVGDEYRFAPVGDDADANDVLTYTIENKPEWAEFNTSSGELYGVPMFLDIGTSAPITISVTDDINTTSLSAFTITVSDETSILPVEVSLPVDMYELDRGNETFEYEKVSLGADNVLKFTGYRMEDNGTFTAGESGYQLIDGEWKLESEEGQGFRVLNNFIDLLGQDTRVAVTGVTSIEGEVFETPEFNVTMPVGAEKYSLTIRSYGEQYYIWKPAKDYETNATYASLDAFVDAMCESKWVLTKEGDSSTGLVIAGDGAGNCDGTEGVLVEVSQSTSVETNVVETAGTWVIKSVDGVEMLVLCPNDSAYQEDDNEFRMYTVFESQVWEGAEEHYNGTVEEIEMLNGVAIEAIKEKAVDKVLGIVARFTPEMLSDTGRVWNIFSESNNTTGEHWYEAATFEFTSTSLRARLGIVNPIDTPLIEADYDITDRGQLHFVDSEDSSENYITIVGLTEQNMTVCWSDIAVPECSEDELEFIYFDQSVAQAALDQMNQNSVLLPDGFIYGVINNKGEAQEISVTADGINYDIKLYADYEEIPDLQQNHKAVRVTVNGVQSLNMIIQNSYGNHNIVAAVYVDGRLVKTSDLTLVNPAAPGVSIVVNVP